MARRFDYGRLSSYTFAMIEPDFTLAGLTDEELQARQCQFVDYLFDDVHVRIPVSSRAFLSKQNQEQKPPMVPADPKVS